MIHSVNKIFYQQFKVQNTSIFNLSNVQLSDDESLVLGLGLAFLPKYTMNQQSIKQSLLESANELKSRIYRGLSFLGRPYQKSEIPSIQYKLNPNPDPNPNPRPGTLAIESYISDVIQSIESLQITSSIAKPYVYLLNVLKKLRQNKEIVIKPADKNLGTCVMDIPFYINMCMDHLNDRETYLPIPDVPFEQCYQILEEICKCNDKYYGFKRKFEMEPEVSYLFKSLSQLRNSPDLRPCKFYCLPKCHKKGNVIKGRPIASSINTVTYHTSKYIHNMIWPLVKSIPTICTSAWSILLEIENLSIPLGSVIFTADVKSLYPSIPIDFGMYAFCQVLDTMNFLSKSDRIFIRDLLCWTLTNNYLEFNNVLYQQIKGTAMGTPCAVAYANIVLYFIEREILDQVIFYKRYIDDVFAIFPDDVSAMKFAERFNGKCESIKFEEINIGPSGIFLDFEFCIVENRLVSKLYQKALNKYLYIPPTSDHQKSVLSNIVKREIFRYRLYCSLDSDFTDVIAQFRTRLLNRGYAVSFLDRCMLPLPTRAYCMDMMKKSLLKRSEASKPFPLVVTFKLPEIKSSQKLSDIFQLPPTVSGLPEFKKSFPDSRVIIGRRNLPSVGRVLVHRKIKNSNISDSNIMESNSSQSSFLQNFPRNFSTVSFRIFNRYTPLRRGCENWNSGSEAHVVDQAS